MTDRRKYQREWVANRRAKWFATHGPCSNCGSWNKLEIHHEDPTQKVSHRVFSWSQKRRDEELAKCKVLCNVCHDLVTPHLHRPVNHIHGTTTEYRRGCRCAACVQAKAVYMKASR